MRYLQETGARLLTLDQIADALDGRAQWPEAGVAVTFDDGFADTFSNALPVLTRYRIPATMFAVSDLIGGSNTWMSARGFPQRKLMSRSDLGTMSTAGFGIGSHTRTHPRLPELDAEGKRREIRDSKARLEDMIGGRRRATGWRVPRDRVLTAPTSIVLRCEESRSLETTTSGNSSRSSSSEPTRPRASIHCATTPVGSWPV
jgi:peptidoglycan/xylan/chitin deacetylase (PgdA/CDA1 family)